jgi:hypothetical protein
MFADEHRAGRSIPAVTCFVQKAQDGCVVQRIPVGQLDPLSAPSSPIRGRAIPTHADYPSYKWHAALLDAKEPSPLL